MEYTDGVKLTDPTYFVKGDPIGILADWRREDPVHWTEGRLSRGFWSLTRYADAVKMLMNDNRIFSVQHCGGCLPQSPDMEDIEASLHTKLMREGANLSAMDGAPHTALRKVFAEKFSVDGIAGLDAIIRRCAREILDEVLPRGECDFVSDIAGRLPLAVIAEMMDIPKEEWNELYRYNNMSAAPEDEEWSIGTAAETSTAGTAALIEYCAKLGMSRRGGSGTDILTMLANTEIEGKLLSPEQIGFNGLMFFAAGHETTRASLSAGLLEMMRDPAQFDTLRKRRREPGALPAFAEESVRWSSPLTHTMRVAMEDIEIGGTQIREGEWVVSWFISANRDEAAFDNPGKFDAARTPNNHLGFAKGKHHCLGAHLARAEMRVMLEYLLDELPEIELAGETEMAASNLFWGLKHMPVKFPAKGPLKKAA